MNLNLADIPRFFFFAKGASEGYTPLNAFDGALIDANVGKFNLVKVSSIIPPRCQEKNDLINQMLEMQKQFIDREHDGGISGKDYYFSQEGLLADYREKYNEMAMKVVDLSHQIVGSSRF